MMIPKFRALIFAVAVMATAATRGAEPTLAIDDTRCEHLVNPLGIDARQPRLTWTLKTVDPQARGLAQKAFQVLVAATKEELAQDKGTRWDSGEVESDQSVLVPYGGKPLGSHNVCWWKVRVWDGDGNASKWSTPSV